ncbi:hypothetical protein KL935_002763 [Ogataea polymorpha]|uniref:GDP-mannose transporter n=1 Tax=Ogataea polymorpha TaxID=460523 RepID=A0A9P8NPU5_9ASCO|nr:hypothetical protein KL908_003126 [Ogataea polymorpha]KAG7900830.1 hypothetical protein KL935_002763 [Ogataea polymorpha]KAG7916607.1 hypothetical protein KL927_003246 [Ogataea polymorpha]KAH3658928.1 hypothetical protein OGATHE_006654 [Ogataea polymorpha]
MSTEATNSQGRSRATSLSETVPSAVDSRRRKSSLSVITSNLGSPKEAIESALGTTQAHRRSHSVNSPLHARSAQGLASPLPGQDLLNMDSLASPALMNSGISSSGGRLNNFARQDPQSLGDAPVSPSRSFLLNIKRAYPHLGITMMSIISWYGFSLSISLYNRWMFSNKNLDFSFPIIITSFHQCILFLLSMLTLAMIPRFRLNYHFQTHYASEAEHLNSDNANSSDELNELLETKKPEQLDYRMPVREYLTKILPCSVASAGDIGLGNTAFRFISLSLYTMIKTSSLVFVLLWGVLFKLERMTWRIVSIVLIMTIGVIMMVWGQHEDDSEPTPIPNTPAAGQIVADPDEDMSSRIMRRLLSRETKAAHLIFLGSILVLGSACMSGLRWALTQIMLKRNPRTTNPILTILYLSPAMSVVLLIMGSLVEGLRSFARSPIWEEKGFGLTCLLILIPGLLAFFMTLSEFVLLQYATLLTLSIAGIFKELLTIFTSWLLFGDKLTFVNLVGLAITLADIVWYNFYRFDEIQNETTTKNKVTPSPSFDVLEHGRQSRDIELNELRE